MQHLHTSSVYFFLKPEQYIVSSIIMRNLAKNSIRICQQLRPTLLFLSKFLVPEQAKVIFPPLCCEKLNRLNEQAKNKPEPFKWFYM